MERCTQSNTLLEGRLLSTRQAESADRSSGSLGANHHHPQDTTCSPHEASFPCALLSALSRVSAGVSALLRLRAATVDDPPDPALDHIRDVDRSVGSLREPGWPRLGLLALHQRRHAGESVREDFVASRGLAGLERLE